MGSDVGGAGHEVLVGRIQMPDVTALHDEEDDPVDARDDDIKGERSPHASVLSPYCVAVMAMVAVCGRIETVVEGRDNYKEP